MEPSAGWRRGGLGLPRQGRQIQLQTRLRSMCRRATSTTCGLGWATVTPTIVPRTPTGRASRSNLGSR
ncbi:hypothetical protein L838_4592 [Mycobacterium avium MAV_120709_2344]|uniref:Uncharacterized protein n=1 Tax=Mycobacterium avium (strain 104) TaxID=243243 RepID=A0A0H2ZWM4_MYCA1|nr:hypothetical protein MAV_1788 [Mycobacterium avium 104]ETZ41690.1 hypothetical protein L838_4592 [Mycobacterium avium MAV_120709_2344]ETZ43278.1 hypothetical protein L839_3699 [Mycobacterium avium MAV_120809_2495]ETZ45846.1 hypothetical protein L837_2352 [Mycobacterium avium MAV_061107_1842]ETZ67037.1 hypothetical protein L840_1689 [Mycobacterium sp. MAC_011194_8550]